RPPLSRVGGASDRHGARDEARRDRRHVQRGLPGRPDGGIVRVRLHHARDRLRVHVDHAGVAVPARHRAQHVAHRASRHLTGVAVPLQGVTPPRPLTHDLFLTLFGRLKVTLTRVVITDLRDDIFYAIVYLNTGGPDFQLDARPSDAIALAIRAKAPVLVEER